MSRVTTNQETLAQQIEAARDISELMEHPGFAALQAGFEEAVARATQILTGKTPTNEGAEYAFATGEIRGLSRLRSIAEAKVKQGKKAEESLRALEETGVR